MTRFAMPVVLCALTGALLCAGALVCAPASADDPPKKLTPEERKKAQVKWAELSATGVAASNRQRPAEAVKAFTAALDLARELYPVEDFKDGHDTLATSLHNLALASRNVGRFEDAEKLAREGLDVRKRMFKGDHWTVAMSMSDLGFICQLQGKFAAAESLLEDGLEMRKRVHKGDHELVVMSLNDVGIMYRNQGKLAAAEQKFEAALEMCRRMFKGDHDAIAAITNNIGELQIAQGTYAAAEPLLRDALDMYRRLFKGAHRDTARCQTNLASVCAMRGKYDEAERLYKAALEMNEQLFKGDNPAVASSLSNLAGLYLSRGRYADAGPLSAEAVAMSSRMIKGDHATVATAMNNHAALLHRLNMAAEAEKLCKDALEMRQRVFKGDHPHVATSLNNMGRYALVAGRYADAEPYCKDAVAMYRRLHKGDHPDLAAHIDNLAGLYHRSGRYADAEPLGRESLEMYRRLVTRFAREKDEGSTLNLLSSLPLTYDVYLSNEQARGADPAAVYAQALPQKGLSARVYETRQQRARAATDPKATAALADLADARRRRAELLVAPATRDPATLRKRTEDLLRYEKTIEVRTVELKPLLPAFDRADRLAADPTALRKALPTDAAVVDFVRFVRFEQDPKVPGKAGETQTPWYLAFVVTRDKISWTDLGPAAKIESAVAAWRDAITGDKEIPAAVPAKVRELMWEKVRKELPAAVKAVYVCPDRALCRVPFAALPGDKAGSILLDDFALATVPHATFLFDKLSPQDKPASSPTGALVVGGVSYKADVATNTAIKTPGPLTDADAKLEWKELPFTAAEAKGVVQTAERKTLAATLIEGDKATPATVLAALPKAKVAHLATHGFFSDPKFRGLFDLDPKDYEVRGGERVGRAANSPLVMTGLVFAGANDPKAPGRGIVTGEQLVDLDLSGLELAVLSACETGVGDVAGGEGTFGLQRAFHYAGATNVVASLWKVPDESTAALMAVFYRGLWEKNLTPIEALRRAQLELYRSKPEQIAKLAKDFRGSFGTVGGSKDVVKPTADGKAHPLLWAAFTLSGPGR